MLLLMQNKTDISSKYTLRLSQNTKTKNNIKMDIKKVRMGE